MKTILVPVEKNEFTTSVLACASLIAGRFAGTVEGVALRRSHIAFVGPDPVVAVTFPQDDLDDKALSVMARRTFDDFFASGAAATRLHRWRGGDPIDDGALGAIARVHDLTVVGRPEGPMAGPRMTTLEAALFESGRPILIAPPRPPQTIGDRIVISWNCSTESARAVAYALPLLAKAQEVVVLSVEGSLVSGPSGAEVAGYLAAHGIAAKELTLSSGSRKPGETILREATRLGADLLLKGAYTQSRLRQMIFGGATSHILAHSELPVLMAH